MKSLELLIFRVLRRLVVLPVTRWWLRCSATQQLEALAALGPGVVVNGTITIGTCSKTYLGRDVSLNPGFTTSGSGKVTIGSHFHSGCNVRIITSNHNYKSSTAIPYDEVRIEKDVTIGDGVWLGDNVLIVPGVQIGDGAIVAGGAVVVRNVPAFAIVGGSPAAIIGQRPEAMWKALVEKDAWQGWPRDHDLIVGKKTLVRRRP